MTALSALVETATCSETVERKKNTGQAYTFILFFAIVL